MTSTAKAAVDPFYDGMFERGIAHYGAGDYVSAQRELRVAAFGFVDELDRFETAHVYCALASSKMDDAASARASVNRVVAAERIAHNYPSLVLAPSIRQQFDVLAKKFLSDADLALLHAPAATNEERTVERKVTPPAPRVTPPPAPQPQPQMQPAPMQSKPVASVVDPPPRAPTVTPVKTTPVPAPSSEPATIADAEKLIASGDLTRARTILTSLLDVPQTPHATMMRIGAGLYRVRNFADAVTAFDRAGPMQSGEEINHYYYAVALYETGRYVAAKQEMTAALPYIENTSDVARYRAKIDGAISK